MKREKWNSANIEAGKEACLGVQRLEEKAKGEKTELLNVKEMEKAKRRL